MASVRWGAASDVGRVREINEDSYLAQAPLFVVADGMGGHAAGEVASATAVAEFAALAARGSLRPEDVIGAVDAANRAIVAGGEANLGQAGMGTTVTGLAVVEVEGQPHWALFNVGDSRVYRYLHGELRQLSIDHSEVNELVAAGRITPEQARVHPARNVVTRSLGTDPGPVADLWVFPPVAGERFVVASDGLNRELEDSRIADLLADEVDPQQAADRLVAEAVAAGGRDNVTVVVVDFEGGSDSTGPGLDGLSS